MSWSKVGFWLVLLTVQLKVSLSSTATSSRTVTVDRVGAAAGGIEGDGAADQAGAGSMLSPAGRPLAA